MLVPQWLETWSPVWHGLFGTLFTWFVTALGAAVVFLVPDGMSLESEGLFLDLSLGFAAGVMLAASYWSLLAPSIEMAKENGYESFSYIPAACGFFLGALFVYAADKLLPETVEDPHKFMKEKIKVEMSFKEGNETLESVPSSPYNLRKRKKTDGVPSIVAKPQKEAAAHHEIKANQSSWRRLLLLVIAVTIHNFPEGLAVGVAFGAVGTSKKATMQAAEVLAWGIGIQNFPEGLAVSIPMRRLGSSKSRCFFYGQLSGMVEPLGGLLGAAAVQIAQPILPYALSFAAGAMIYVVVDSIIPEAQTRGNSKSATLGCMLGFMVMMTLDVALG